MGLCPCREFNYSKSRAAKKKKYCTSVYLFVQIYYKNNILESAKYLCWLLTMGKYTIWSISSISLMKKQTHMPSLSPPSTAVCKLDQL